MIDGDALLTPLPLHNHCPWTVPHPSTSRPRSGKRPGLERGRELGLLNGWPTLRGRLNPARTHQILSLRLWGRLTKIINALMPRGSSKKTVSAGV